MLQRFQMHASQRADDFEMAEFLGPDVHQQILAFRVITVQPLNRILHGGGKFAVRPAELFEQHVSKTGIGFTDVHRIHQLFYVVIHAI